MFIIALCTPVRPFVPLCIELCVFLYVPVFSRHLLLKIEEINIENPAQLRTFTIKTMMTMAHKNYTD